VAPGGRRDGADQEQDADPRQAISTPIHLSWNSELFRLPLRSEPLDFATTRAGILTSEYNHVVLDGAPIDLLIALAAGQEIFSMKRDNAVCDLAVRNDVLTPMAPIVILGMGLFDAAKYAVATA
jgi:hypothetical protein